MQNNVTYHLVLEARPGDFMPIDINLLLNNTMPINYTSLNEIDEFTKKYTEKEIFEMIKKSNIVPDQYLTGKLEIINDNKYRYMVMTSDLNFALDTFIAEYIVDKQVMNRFLNIYIKYCKETKEEMKNAISSGNVYGVLDLLFCNNYENIRNIYAYLYENIILKN